MYKLKLKYIEYDEKLSPRQRRTLEHSSAYDLLYDMLFEYFNISSPEIFRNENGKPYVKNEGVFFSLSHTSGLAVCVVADSEIGVDCEKLLPKSNTEIQKFANRYFVENEIALLQKSDFSALDFYKIWTAKEATIKKRGTNMSDIKKIDTTKENFRLSLENDYIISINI